MLIIAPLNWNQSHHSPIQFRSRWYETLLADQASSPALSAASPPPRHRRSLRWFQKQKRLPRARSLRWLTRIPWNVTLSCINLIAFDFKGCLVICLISELVAFILSELERIMLCIMWWTDHISWLGRNLFITVYWGLTLTLIICFLKVCVVVTLGYRVGIWTLILIREYYYEGVFYFHFMKVLLVFHM